MLQSVNCCRSTLVQLLSQREPNKCVLQCVEPPANHVWVRMQSFAPQQDEGSIKCAQCILAPCAHTSITTGKKYISSTTQLQLASNPNNFCIIPIQILISTAQKQIIFNVFFNFLELLFRAVFYRWILFILAMKLLMGCYASLNKLKLSSILLMIMADTLWLILSEKQGILILWFSPILSHSLGLLQCLWTIWRLTPVPLQRGFQFKCSRSRNLKIKLMDFRHAFPVIWLRDLMAGIHLNEALLLPTGEIFAILLSPGNTIILEPRNRHPPTNLKDCLSV